MKIKITYPIGSFVDFGGVKLKVKGMDIYNNEIKYLCNNEYLIWEKEDYNFGLRQAIIREPLIIL